MLTKFRHRSIVAVILALSGVAPASAQVGTRASGMAGAYVGVADDATAVYWNPAGVATGALVSVVIGGGGQTVARGAQLEDRQHDTAAVVAISATAVGVAYYRIGTYGKSVTAPAVTSPLNREEVRRSVQGISTSTVGVSLVQSLGQFVVVGVTPKIMNGSSGDASGYELDADAGVMVAINRVRLGLVARNLTTPSFTGGGREVALDREVRVGGAWGSGWTGISRVIASVDGDLTSRPTPYGDRRDVAAGLETWWMGQRLGLRGGGRRSTIGEARAAFAAGISAGLSPGLLLEAHVVRGHAAERSWSVGARMLF